MIKRLSNRKSSVQKQGRNQYADILSSWKKSDTDPKIKKIFYVAIILAVANLVFQLFATYFLPPEIPLLYGMPEGEQQLINSSSFYFSATAGIGIVLLNFLLTKLSQNGFFHYSMAISSVCINLFIFITGIKIFTLVGLLF